MHIANVFIGQELFLILHRLVEIYKVVFSPWFSIMYRQKNWSPLIVFLNSMKSLNWCGKVSQNYAHFNTFEKLTKCNHCSIFLSVAESQDRSLDEYFWKRKECRLDRKVLSKHFQHFQMGKIYWVPFTTPFRQLTFKMPIKFGKMGFQQWVVCSNCVHLYVEWVRMGFSEREKTVWKISQIQCHLYLNLLHCLLII